MICTAIPNYPGRSTGQAERFVSFCLRFRDTGRLFDPTQYIRQFRAAPQDPAKNVGLRIVSGTAAEMRYITLLNCNIVILRFSGSDETFS